MFASDSYMQPAHLSLLGIIGISLGSTAFGIFLITSFVTLTYFQVFKTNRYLDGKLMEIKRRARETYGLDTEIIDGEFDEIWT